MNWNIKLCSLVFLFIQGLVLAQEDKIPNTNQYVPDDPETVFLQSGFFSPISLKESSWQNYGTPLGFELEFNWFAFPEVTIGAQFHVFGSDTELEKISHIGNIKSSTSNFLAVDIGYYHAFNREWNLHTSFGTGYLYNRHRSPDDRFTEEGNALFLESALGYRFNKRVALFFKTAIRWDRMGINAVPAHLSDYFNKHSLLLLGSGIRINFQNPGG